MSWTDSFAEATELEIPSQLVRSQDRSPCSAEELNLDDDRIGSGPPVSVIVTTYRDGNYLPDALESIGEQTYGNLELIVVDSSGLEWLEQLNEEHSWIEYMYQKPRGVSAARNAGIARASGEYVAFLDADDYWHPEKIERQIAALEDRGDVSYTCYYFVKFWGRDEPVVKLRDRHRHAVNSARVALTRQRIDAHTSTLVVRSSVLPDRPFRENLKNFEDIVFAIELFSEYEPVHVEEPLSVRRLRRGSLSDRTPETSKVQSRIEAYEYLSREYPDLQPHARRMQAREEFKLGWTYLEQGDKDRAKQYFRRSIHHAPSNYKAMMLYLVSLAPIDGKTTCHILERLYDSFSGGFRGKNRGKVKQDSRVSIRPLH